MAGPYINQEGYEVPDNKILVIPMSAEKDFYYDDIIEPLFGNSKRDWFTPHFYYCLPLLIANQYGFAIKSTRDFEIIWNGGMTLEDTQITFLDSPEQYERQIIKSHFGQGVVTIQHMFSLKTPLGINLMTIQQPNLYLPGCISMSGVVETDQIRRDFTFNIKVTVPNIKISVKKGQVLGAFIPIPRYFVDKFSIDSAFNHYDDQIVYNELSDARELSRQRSEEDAEKAHLSGRKYFNGIHAFGESFTDHQKRVGNVQ